MTLSPTTPASITTMRAREGERKEFDSPLTTQTDISSSYGDHNDDHHNDQVLMTPPPMPSRLGRIIVSSQTSSSSSSSPSTMDSSGSYVITNGEDGDESRTSSQHHRRLNMRSASTNKQEDSSSQNEALVHALQQLQKLATLDSTEYQQRLLENTLPTLQTEKPTLFCPALAVASSSPSSSLPSSQSPSKELSALSQSIQTPLVQLSMSIHRLHAAVANITKEVDGHTDEVQELQAELAKLRHRNHQVETAAKKVHKKNLQLQKQSKHDRRKAKGMYQKVKEYEAQLESQGFQLMASKVQNHEIQLQLSKTHSRERIDSNTSEFLDVEEDETHDHRRHHEDEDAASHCHSESVQTSCTSTTSTTTGAESPSRQPLSESFLSTQSDLSSRTEDSHSVPVIRFSKEGILTPERRTPNNRQKSCREKPTSPSSSTCVASTTSADDGRGTDGDGKSAPENKEKQKNQSKEKPKQKDHSRSDSNPESFSDRFARFLGPRAIANYNLRIVPPCNIQFVEIPLEASSHHQVVEDHGIIVPSNDGSTDSPEEGRLPDSKKALAVCGLQGFNDFVNMKPTIGAQLTKINGDLVGERCTLEQLYNDLDKHTGRKPVVLTFRNEKWDEEQTKILNAAIRDTENGVPPRGIPSKEKAGGASLFESSQNANGPQQQQQQQQNPRTAAPAPAVAGEESHAPRIRTSSGDSVGKAIHGIGNFLHSLHHPEGGSSC